MHSRIYQLVPNHLTPEDSDFLTTASLCDSDVPFADYIDDIRKEDLPEEYQWFKDAHERFSRIVIEEDEAGHTLVTFKKGCQEEYFRDRWIDLKDSVEALTLPQFSMSKNVSISVTDETKTWYHYELFKIKELIEDRYAFYAYVDYPVTMDSFIRNLDFSKQDEYVYRLGGVVDYHF